MNANELADYLEKAFYADEDISKSATMLRQQQAEIEALKGENSHLKYEISSGVWNPVKELNNGGEPIKNATYWKRQYNLMASQNDNLKSGLYHANEQIKYLESHPVKELTREDRLKLIGTLKWAEDLLREAGHDEAVSDAQDCLMILRKAQENENKP
jgi:predicted RNase H-like nuclease (RuvC/YqgF family)